MKSLAALSLSLALRHRDRLVCEMGKGKSRRNFLYERALLRMAQGALEKGRALLEKEI